MTVRAKEAEIVRAIVEEVAIDVVDVQDERLAEPGRRERAFGSCTAIRNTSVNHGSTETHCDGAVAARAENEKR